MVQRKFLMQSEVKVFFFVSVIIILEVAGYSKKSKINQRRDEKKKQNEDVLIPVQSLNKMKLMVIEAIKKCSSYHQAIDYEQLKADNEALAKKVEILEAALDNMEQNSKNQFLVFGGMTESLTENTDRLVIHECKKLGIQVQTNDIDLSYRIGKNDVKVKKTRNIIVKFNSYRLKSDILEAALLMTQKLFKTLQDGSKNYEVVNIQELLTTKRYHLYSKVIELKRKHRIKQCFTRDGTIVANYGTHFQDVFYYINKDVDYTNFLMILQNTT